MNLDLLDFGRKTRPMGIRVYEDQLQALRRLIVSKYRGRLKISDLIREAIDEYIEREKDR